MKFWLRILGAAAVLVLLCSAQVPAGEEDNPAPTVMDMEEAVKTGLERSHRIQAEEYGIQRSESEVKSVRGEFLPQVSAGAGYTYLDNRYTRDVGLPDDDYLDHTQFQSNLRVVQTVFAGLTILSSYQQAQIEKEISEIEKETAERELIREIQHHFLELLKAQEDRRSLESSVERLEVSLEASQSFYERQLVPYADVLQAEVELEEARQDLNQAKNEEQIQRSHLNALLGFGHDRLINYQGDLAEIPLEKFFQTREILDTALEERTELQFIHKNMAATEKEKRIARGQRLPRVNLEFNYAYREREYEEDHEVTDDERNRYWTAGVQLEWDIFTGGQRHYQREGMDHEIRRLVETLKDTRASILTEVRTAHMRLEEARERLVSTRKALAAAQENFEMQQHRYKQRVGTIQDLLTAQEHLTDAETRKNQALMDYQQAMSELYFAMGKRNYGLN